jgi:hypothetical protein
MDSTTTSNDKRPCFGTRLCAELKRLILLSIIVGLVVIAAKYYGFDRLNEEIRSQVEAKLRTHYQGLTVTVRSARRMASRGVEIRGIRIAEAGGRSAPVLAEIDEIVAYCDTRLPDFLTRPPQITALSIHRLKLRAERKPNGRWNLVNLLPLPSCDGACAPQATITDGTLELVDPALHRGATSGLMLRNIELSVAPEEQAGEIVLRVRGTLAGDHVERVEIAGALDPVTCKWELRGAVEGLEFSPRLRAALPQELSDTLAPLSSIRGRTFFGFYASRGPRAVHQPNTAPPIQFHVEGKISEGRIDDARLPEPLTDVEAKIRCDNSRIHIDELSARCGPTHLELTGAITGYTGMQPIDLTVAARDVQLEQLPLATLPPAARESWHQFQPRGIADITGQLHFDGSRWQPDLEIKCHDLSLCYQRFPYRVTDGVGVIVVKPQSCTTDLRLAGGGSFVRCRADVRNLGPQFTGWIQLQSDGPVAIDEKLLAAMDGASQHIVRGFQPRGSASFFARFHRDIPDDPLHRNLEIRLHDCSIEHERFTYPIDRVSGTLTAEDETWFFQNLLGRNDCAEITGEGSWRDDGRDGRRLALNFLARNVPLADELRQALPKSAQGLWSNLHPRGNLDRVAVNLSYSTATQQWSIDLTAQKGPPQGGTGILPVSTVATSPFPAIADEGRSISLEPGWFRYALNDVTGGLRYRDGRVELTNLRATHGHAKLYGQGKCAMLTDGGYRLEMTNLTADRVDVDQDLLAALPGNLSQSLTRLPLEGPVNVHQGRLAITAPSQSTTPVVTWDLDLDIENGRLLTSTPVEHIRGGATLRGQHGREGLFARGELNIDSAMIRGLQLARLQGPYWFDGRQLVFGTFADRDKPTGAPRQVSARLLGGLLSVDGMVLLSGDGAFDIQGTLENANLAEIARELAPHQPTPAGKVYVLAHLAGNAQGKHTWNGEGVIRLRDADLYELPAMVTLLKLLSIQRPNSTAFTNSNAEFRIEGDDLVFDRIDFSGDVISLKGKGRMNSQRQIDLKFYPLVGREERHLPFLLPLLGHTGRELMLIEVTGTVDQPEITRTPFPHLDARLQQLFPELGQNESAIPARPSSTPPREAVRPLRPGTWR